MGVPGLGWEAPSPVGEMVDLSHVERELGAEPWPGGTLGSSLSASLLSSPRELNGNKITRIHKDDFAGLKQLRVL